MSIERLHTEEQGVALMTALLAVVILTGLSVVFVGRSLTETQVSAASRDLETAVHAAEASADVLIHQLGGAGASTGADFVHEMPSGVDEREWARSLLDDMRGDGDPASTWVDTPAGQAYAVQPAEGGEVKPVVLAVGAVPSFDAERARVRVVRIQIDKDAFQPEFAYLTDAVFEMKGDASVRVEGCQDDGTGCDADVHANDGVKIQGGSAVIEGRVSTPGSADCKHGNAVHGCVDGDDGVTREEVPLIRARDFYNPTAHSDWYDLCPGGEIRLGTASGPCALDAPVVWKDSDDTTESLGWSWEGDQWKGGSVQSGVFYVYRSDAKITGSAGGMQRTTILAESDPPIGSDTGPVTGGSVAITGNARFEAAIPDVALVVDRDLRMAGNGITGDCESLGAHSGGLVSVGEQLHVTGTADLHGAVIEQNREDRAEIDGGNSGGSGSMCLKYDGDLAVDLAGYWTITYWNEL